MAAIFGPLRGTYRYLQRCAHEQPVIFYSLAIGWIGPVAVITVPSFRKNYLGWVPPEAVPTTYPLPQRKREEVTGYDDE
ncbi:hypothetical protein BDZ90DRAFT_277458 [Jaminaea rosea]|uniref:NADH-ubiquinone oxidoreductase 9.5 kDa subunit n=1 Tax=Jaminaea rosea TaxID=1569628 RepID=A0A316V0H8_9BASI|nr:hypothetical protein BDZ90DRAFT_277458 [Jaminaea rosea]PWN31050.1 hypothetical protein BDZ90DRAFT_277458 [Jaminaea rosea]